MQLYCFLFFKSGFSLVRIFYWFYPYKIKNKINRQQSDFSTWRDDFLLAEGIFYLFLKLFVSTQQLISSSFFWTFISLDFIRWIFISKAKFFTWKFNYLELEGTRDDFLQLKNSRLLRIKKQLFTIYPRLWKDFHFALPPKCNWAAVKCFNNNHKYLLVCLYKTKT